MLYIKKIFYKNIKTMQKIKNFLKIYLLSCLIQITPHSFSFAEIGLTENSMLAFNPKNPFKTSFAPLKDKADIYYYVVHDSYRDQYCDDVDRKLKLGIKPKEKHAFVNDYVVFLNDNNKEFVKDLDQNLKFEGNKVNILIVHPRRYAPGVTYGPWVTFKCDPIYQSGDPKDLVQIFSHLTKKPVYEEIKAQVEKKIHQLKENDNLKKFFNNKPMNIKALDIISDGRWSVNLNYGEYHDGECSNFLKQKYRNNLDPKNFHIVIVPFHHCLYKKTNFNFFIFKNTIDGIIQTNRPILGFVSVAEVLAPAFKNVENRTNTIKQAASKNPDELVLIKLKIESDSDYRQVNATKLLSSGKGVCMVGEKNDLKVKAIFINHFNKKFENKVLNMNQIKFFKDTNSLYDFARKNKKKLPYEEVFTLKECLNMFVPVKDMDKLQKALRKAEKIWLSTEEPKLFANLDYAQIVLKYYGTKDESEYLMLASNYLNFNKNIFDILNNNYKINSLTILENNFNEMITNMPQNRGRTTQKKTSDLLYYLKNKNMALNSKEGIKTFFVNLNTAEIKRAKERAKRLEEQRQRRIADYKKNGAPLSKYQIWPTAGKTYVKCIYVMGDDIFIPFFGDTNPRLKNFGCPPKRRIN